MSEKNDKGIARAAEWLLKGAKMLQRACPQCEAPLYLLKDNKVYCATCETQVVILGPNDPVPPEFEQSSQEKSFSSSEMSQAEKVLSKKLLKLTEDLDEADDVDDIIKLTEAIEKITGALKKLQ